MERQLAAKRATAGGGDTQFGLAIGEERFKLGVALKALGHTRHLRPSGTVATHLAMLVVLLAAPLKLLPAIHKLIGSFLPGFPNSPLGLHGENGATDLTIGSFVRERLFGEIGTLNVA